MENQVRKRWVATPEDEALLPKHPGEVVSVSIDEDGNEVEHITTVEYFTTTTTADDGSKIITLSSLRTEEDGTTTTIVESVRPVPATDLDRLRALTSGSTYKKAAALVDLANDERGIPEEIHHLPNIGRVEKFYFLFNRLKYIWSLNYYALMIFNFFEKPLWCSSVLKVSCSNRHYYYLGELPYLTNAGSLAIEGVTFIILVVHTLYPVLYEGVSIYWSHRANKVKVILLLILAVDLVVYILHLSLEAIHTLPFRSAPYLRVVFFVLHIRDLRDSLVVLVGMVRTYLNVLILCLVFLLFSSWLAYVIFEDTQQGYAKFVSYPATLYQLLVLFTTSNNPDAWIPAYNSSRWSFLFFALFVLLGVYFLTNLVLAVVYESFESGLAKQITKKDQRMERILQDAFNVIDDHELGHINKQQCILLFRELKRYRTLPAMTDDEFDSRFVALDKNKDLKIDAAEFNELLNVIAIKYDKAESKPWQRKFNFYRSPFSEKLIAFVKSRKFEYVVVIVLVFNLAVMIAETMVDIQNKSGHKSWQKVEFVFAWIYLFEVVVRFYTYGFENYINNSDNLLNFIHTLVIVIGEILTLVSPNKLKFISNDKWIRSLLIARMLRFIRLLMHVPNYQSFVDTFLYLIPSLMPYLGTIFCVMCIYCTLGVQIFGGLVNAENSRLPSTDLYASKYLSFNFNDYLNGMVTLFNLIVMGSWHVWMKDYATLKGTSWTYMYFVSFYVITVLLLLNLIVAFVMQAFFAEIDLKLSEKQKDVEGTGTSGGRRQVGTRSRQRVNILVHHMLSRRLKRPLPASSEASPSWLKKES